MSATEGMTRTEAVIVNRHDVLMPAEVGAMYGVDGKTITRWANEGLLPYFTTPGGHRRFYRAEIQAKIDATRVEARR